MNYLRIYAQLMLKARVSGRVKHRTNHKDYVYYERHHIKPRCMGGKDVTENYALLTAKEHFVAHRLLCKIYPDRIKLKKAVVYMSKRTSKNCLCPYTSKFFITSREYERMRTEVLEYYLRPENVRVYVNDGLGCRFVPKCEVDFYLKSGWAKGKLTKSTRPKVFIHKQGIRREVSPILVKYYISAGWSLGNYSEAKPLMYAEFDSSYAWISNGESRALIGKDALPYALRDGWKNVSRIGKCKGYSRNRVAIQKEGIIKFIKKDVLHLWQKAGWVETYAQSTGNLAGTKYQGSHYVTKEEVCYCVTSDVLPYFLEDGWIQGKPKTMYDSRRGKDYIFINNGSECMRVLAAELEDFLIKGWTKGRINKSSLITIGKDGYLKQIDSEYLALWQKAGWFRVVNPKKTKTLRGSPYIGNIKINNGKVELSISSDVLPYFLEDGWIHGRIKTI